MPFYKKVKCGEVCFVSCETGTENKSDIRKLTEKLELSEEKIMTRVDLIVKDLEKRSDSKFGDLKEEIEKLKNDIEDDFAHMKVQVLGLEEKIMELEKSNVKMELQISQIFEILKRLEDSIKEIKDGTPLSNQFMEEIRMIIQEQNKAQAGTTDKILDFAKEITKYAIAIGVGYGVYKLKVGV